MKLKETPTGSNKWKYTSVVLAILLVATVIYIFAYARGDIAVREGQRLYPMIDITRHLIPQEDFLPTLQPLRIRLRELVAAEPDMKISVYIEYLNTGANINLLPEERFIPASLSKLPIAIATLGTIERGIWTLDQVFTLEKEDVFSVSSDIHDQPIGTKFTARELLEDLLIRSDNTAYRILLRNLPGSEISAFSEAIGLDNLFNEKGEVTTKEYSRTVRTLYTASYLNREHSQYLLELMNKAEFTDFLRMPVPEEVPFPHKFGVGLDNSTYNDSGIVYLENRPYLITVMIESLDMVDSEVELTEVKRTMRAISNMSYQFFSTANYETP